MSNVPLPDPYTAVLLGTSLIGWEDAYSADQLRSYGDARAAEMRERCAKACDGYVASTGRGLSGDVLRSLESQS